MSDILDEDWMPGAQAAASRVGEEIVLLHLGSGTYFGLDPLGARIWQELESGRAPRSLCQAIAADFAEQPDRVEGDVRAFLGQLAEHGLIERR